MSEPDLSLSSDSEDISVGSVIPETAQQTPGGDDPIGDPDSPEAITTEILGRQALPPATSEVLFEAWTFFKESLKSPTAGMLFLIYWVMILTMFYAATLGIPIIWIFRSAGDWFDLVWLILEIVFLFFLAWCACLFNHVVLLALRKGSPCADAPTSDDSPPVCSVLALKFITIPIILCGLVCLLIPGIYLAVCFTFTELLFLEFGSKGLTKRQCLEISREVVHRDWFWWLSFNLILMVTCLIPFVGPPVAIIAFSITFRDIFGQTKFDFEAEELRKRRWSTPE
jgi:hypothetical protein